MQHILSSSAMEQSFTEPVNKNMNIKTVSRIALPNDKQSLSLDVMTLKPLPLSRKNETFEKSGTRDKNSVDLLEVCAVQLQDHSRSSTTFEELRVNEENFEDCAGDRIKSFRDPNLPALSRSTKARDFSRRWLILIGSSFTMAMSTGFPFNMSVLYVEFLHAFGKSKAITSLVQSVTAGMFFISGFFSGIAINRFGARRVGIPATILTSVGVGLSYFATGIEFLLVFLSMFSGIGLSLTYIGTFNIISEYFKGKSKVLATSFAVFGSGVGALSFPYLQNILIRNYGWRGCLLIISGIILNMVPCIAVWKPRYPIEAVKIKHTPAPQDGTRNGKRKDLQNRLRSLLRNKIYLINTLALALTLPFLNAVLFMIIDFLIFSGFTRDKAVFLIFIMNFTGVFFGRMIPGICKQVPHMSTLAIPIFYSGLGSMSLFLFPYVKHYTEYVIVVCAFGISHAGTSCILPITNMRIVGYRDYSIGFGISLSVIGMVNTASGPITGFIRDVTGSYDKAFFVCGACVGFGCILFCFELCLRLINGLEIDNSLDMEVDIKRRQSRGSSIFPWKAGFDIMP